MKKVVIIEPNPEVRDLLKTAVKAVTGEEIQTVEIPRFTDARGVVESHLDAQVVFVTLDAPTQRGGEVAREIKCAHPNLKVVLTSSVDGQRLADEFGLNGFLSKFDFCKKEKMLPFLN